MITVAASAAGTTMGAAGSAAAGITESAPPTEQPVSFGNKWS
jgi:hypothetical protein